MIRLTVALALMGASAMELTAAHPEPDEARIAEIAEWLPEEPSAAGARITDRTAWGRFKDDPEAEKIVELAEKVVRYPVPDMPPVWYLEWFTTDYIKEGDSRRWREPFWKRSSYLQVLLLAECLEDKGRFLARLVQYLELIPTECAWTEPAHDRSHSTFNGTHPVVDLGVAERCALLAYALDWLKDRIPTSTREKALAEMRRRAFLPYLDHGENWSHNNWNPVCNGCVIRAALALEPDRKLRARFVEAAERTAPFFLNGFRSDGYCGEGLDYWNYGFGRFLPLVLDVRRVTGGRVDLGRLPRAREAMAYGYEFQLEPYLTPRFSDGMANEPSSMCLALGRMAWPDLTSRRAETAALLLPSLDRVACRAFDPGSAELHDHPVSGALRLPMRSWFPEAQVYLGRPANGDERMPFSVCLKGGWNGDPHNHNDVGTYVLMLGGVEMVCDPGGEEYTKRTFSDKRYESKILNSYGHPVPVVNGGLQGAGGQFAAKVLRTTFGERMDEVTLDLLGAYKAGAAEKLERTLRYRRAVQALEVADRVAFAEPCGFETAILTKCRVEKTDDPLVFYLVGNQPNRRVRVTVSATGGALKVREERLENPKRVAPTRLGFAFTAPVTEASISVAYAVMDSTRSK